MSASGFWTRVHLNNSATSIPFVALIAAYLGEVLDLPQTEWRDFLVAVAGWVTAMIVLGQWLLLRRAAPVARWLARHAAEDAPAAFATVVDLPRVVFLQGFVLCTLGATAIALHASLVCPSFGPFQFSVVVGVAVSGSLVQILLCAYLLKRLLEPLREELTRAVPDVELRHRLVRPLPLSLKLRLTLMALSVVPLVFALFLTQSHAGRPLEDLVVKLQETWLLPVIERFAREGGAALHEARQQAAAAPHLGSVVVVDLAGEPARPDVPDVLTRAELEAMRIASGDHGDGRELTSRHVFAWRRVPGTELALAVTTPWSAVAGALADLRWLLGAVVCGATLMSFAVAYLLSRDLGRTTSLLSAEADRLASGDFRGRVFIDSEDDLGALARAFERMAGNFRSVAGRVVEAADRIDGAARDLETVGAGVTDATVGQVEGIQQAANSMEEIDAQVRGIAKSAQDLSVTVEDSSSAILELGATGEELSQTASVLSRKVEEVATSIELTIGSVREVSRSTAGLAQAASETSSSMEEMAGSMREVDSNAAETGRLSASVVSLADGGQEKVRLTMVGMETIQEATETAERVIRSLAGRVREIGAIVDVIENVADETNLLALNAAIIASQAGEQGRAFSVVADEIKDLADRVVGSTREIGALIRAVQEESGNATGAIERGSESVARGVELSAEAGGSLEEITVAARTSGDRIAEIVSAVREQARAAAHVVELTERVRDGVDAIRQAGGAQERGNEVVLAGTGIMREVAQQVHRSTEEQARGASRIREAIETVHEAVEQIGRALGDQSAACQKAAAFMEQVHARTRDHEEATRRMGAATHALRAQAGALREDVARFKL